MKRYIHASEEIKELTVEDYASVSDKEMTKLRDKYVDKMMDKLEKDDPDYYSSAGNYADRQTRLLKEENDKIREARRLNKESVNASTKLDEFMRYFTNEHNEVNNQNGFDRMYDILSKYEDMSKNPDELENVDVVFERATPEDQDRMIELIRPFPEEGTIEAARQLYYDALESNDEYSQGVKDAFAALIDCGLIHRSDI